MDAIKSNEDIPASEGPSPSSISPMEYPKTHELTTNELSRLETKIRECAIGIDLKVETSTNRKFVLFNGKELLFGNISGQNSYNITAKTGSPELLLFTQRLIQERHLVGGCSQNKYWVKNCYDAIVYITTIVDGIKVITEVTKWVCEQEWVDEDTPTTPHHVPFNPEHVRSRSHI